MWIFLLSFIVYVLVVINLRKMSYSRTSINSKRKYVLGADDDDNEELKYLEKVVLGVGNDIFQEDAREKSDADEEPVKLTKLPAWEDESDDLDDMRNNENNHQKQSQINRENQFLQVAKRPKWATSVESKNEKNTILKKCGNLIKKTKKLEKGMIEIKKLRDLNNETYNEGPINVVKFHPRSTIALVAGLSGVVSLFQVGGKENTKLQSIKFHKFPIHCGAFVNNAEEFVVGSKYHKYFQTFNLMTGQSHKVNNNKMDGMDAMRKLTVSPDDKIMAVCGKYGKIHILTTKTKECVDCLHMNCNVSSVAFSNDGSKMYSCGEDGEVYIWDMKERRCLKKFVDDGCIKGTAIDVSSNDAYLACGSSTGIVNIYDIKRVLSEKANPIKTIYNLVTAITDVKFNATSDLLSISSFHKENAVKLLHLSSMTIYSNFPAQNIKLNCISCVDFSPNSGYYAIGDSKRIVHLYRLKYYGNY